MRSYSLGEKEVMRMEEARKMLVKPMVLEDLEEDLDIYGYECAGHVNCDYGCTADCVVNVHCEGGSLDYDCTAELVMWW